MPDYWPRSQDGDQVKTRNTFWDWFVRNESKLGTASPQDVAALIEERMAILAPGLGVEVCRHSGSELIITAGGEPTLFPIVDQLVQSAPKIDGWHFIALKPARGFDFKVDAVGRTIRAAELRFEPLRSKERPIVETEIGERAAAAIAHVDAAPIPTDIDDRLRLKQLSPFLAWEGSRRS